MNLSQEPQNELADAGLWPCRSQCEADNEINNAIF